MNALIVTLDLAICYSSLAVYDPLLEDPFNSWTKAHSDQGFSWRPGSVSFQTLREGPTLQLEARIADDIRPGAEALCAIQVPFCVPASGQVGVSDMVSEFTVPVPAGQYALLFETGLQDQSVYENEAAYRAAEEAGLRRMWARLTFVPAPAAPPDVLRAGPELSPRYPLLMQAEAALP